MRKKTAEQRVDEWNRKFNIGDTVGLVRPSSNGKISISNGKISISNGKISITTIRERAAVVGTEPVVWLEGIYGGFSLDRVWEVEFLTPWTTLGKFGRIA